MAEEKIVASNRKARHDYHILGTYEAGIVLQGTEVKSIRQGQANLKDSFARIEGGEIFLHNLYINPYKFGIVAEQEPTRRRKLLLHKREIKKLLGKTAERGLTLIPLQLYFKQEIVKVELALAKGKRSYDKRQDLKKREANREIERAVKERR
ncbi:SsrA-binding protein SmpB [candidate division NPL-UPA2 bacterium]|nr:SsrA-binding protein SmpB [candidate division NPL-UPA2 bacterium]